MIIYKVFSALIDFKFQLGSVETFIFRDEKKKLFICVAMCHIHFCDGNPNLEQVIIVFLLNSYPLYIEDKHSYGLLSFCSVDPGRVFKFPLYPKFQNQQLYSDPPQQPPHVRNDDKAVSFPLKPGTTLNAMRKKCKDYTFIEIEDCEKVSSLKRAFHTFMLYEKSNSKYFKVFDNSFRRLSIFL